MIKSQYLYNAFVKNVVDGDTIDVDIDLGFEVKFTTRLRLNGVDTPERNDKDPVIREAANKATEYVKSMILGKWVTLESFKKDKFGRYLADIYIGGVCLNQSLITEGHAVAYFGGAK